MGSKRKQQTVDAELEDSDSTQSKASKTTKVKSSKKRKASKHDTVEEDFDIKEEFKVTSWEQPAELISEVKSSNKKKAFKQEAMNEDFEEAGLLVDPSEWKHPEELIGEEEAIVKQDLNGTPKLSDKDPGSWPREDVLTLCEKMEQLIPKNDKLKFSTRINKLNWETIAFDEYSADECKQMWDFVEKSIRGFRVLQEMINDAKEWAKVPWAKKRHPNMPRRPLSSYMIYYMQNKDKAMHENPNIDVSTLSKIIAEKFRNLSPASKEKYIKLAAKERDDYLVKIREFYEMHPEMEPPKKSGGEIGPKKPFRLYYEHVLKKQGDVADKNAAMEKSKANWKKMSDTKKMLWINKALAQTGVVSGDAEKEMDYKQKLVNLLTKEERALKDKMAGKPDRPPTSVYRLFFKEYLEENPTVDNLDLKQKTIEISQKWKLTTASEKNQLKEKLNTLKEKYCQDYKTYIESLTPEEKLHEKLCQEIEQKRHTKKKRLEESDKTPRASSDVPIEADSIRVVAQKKKSPVTENMDNIEGTDDIFEVPNESEYLGEPQRPPRTAFMLYATTKAMKAEHPYTKKALKEMWAGLSAKKKQKYETRLKELKTVYITNYETFLKSLPKEDLKKYAIWKQNESTSQLQNPDSSSESHSEDSDSEDESDSSDSDKDKCSSNDSCDNSEDSDSSNDQDLINMPGN